MIGWIPADWPAPGGIVAGTTTRSGGVSDAGFASLNLGGHVGDAPDAVAANRARFADALGLSQEPAWLEQVHGSSVLRIVSAGDERPAADASVTAEPGMPLVIMTADCLPVLLANRDGTEVGAAHGGWRSLAGGILSKTVEAMAPGELVAWLGPAISQPNFEVGAEVREAFVGMDPALDACFELNERARYQADLYMIARHQLLAAGVSEVHGGGFCTYADDTRFYSHRRDPQCGRMATVIQIPRT